MPLRLLSLSLPRHQPLFDRLTGCRMLPDSPSKPEFGQNVPSTPKSAPARHRAEMREDPSSSGSRASPSGDALLRTLAHECRLGWLEWWFRLHNRLACRAEVVSIRCEDSPKFRGPASTLAPAFARLGPGRPRPPGRNPGRSSSGGWGDCCGRASAPERWPSFRPPGR